jgi:metal-responsive CopG/Arc/MetJ family transcriptional regulator
MATQYTTVKIPDPILERIEEIIRSHPEYAYRNRSEFIVEAIREKVRSIESREK